jgi:hypothetical protein
MRQDACYAGLQLEATRKGAVNVLYQTDIYLISNQAKVFTTSTISRAIRSRAYGTAADRLMAIRLRPERAAAPLLPAAPVPVA